MQCLIFSCRIRLIFTLTCEKKLPVMAWRKQYGEIRESIHWLFQNIPLYLSKITLDWSSLEEEIHSTCPAILNCNNLYIYFLVEHGLGVISQAGYSRCLGTLLCQFLLLAENIYQALSGSIILEYTGN